MSDTPRFVQFVVRRPILRTAIILAIFAVLAIFHLEVNLSRLGDAASNLVVIAGEAWPPDFSILTKRASWAYPPCELQTDWMCSPAVLGMTQTVEIAFLATIFGMAI